MSELGRVVVEEEMVRGQDKALGVVYEDGNTIIGCWLSFPCPLPWRWRDTECVAS